MSHGRFCKTVIRVTVLSEGPFEYENLNDVYHAITTGDCSGEVKTVEAQYLTPSGKRKEF